MQIIRTAFWVVLTALLVAFMAMNWEKVPVNFWPIDAGYLHFDWPVSVIALFFFVLGAGPAWLVHLAGRWRMKRRIALLEDNLRAAAPAPPPMPPFASSTELASGEDAS